MRKDRNAKGCRFECGRHGGSGCFNIATWFDFGKGMCHLKKIVAVGFLEFVVGIVRSLHTYYNRWDIIELHTSTYIHTYIHTGQSVRLRTYVHIILCRITRTRSTIDSGWTRKSG